MKKSLTTPAGMSSIASRARKSAPWRISAIRASGAFCPPSVLKVCTEGSAQCFWKPCFPVICSFFWKPGATTGRPSAVREASRIWCVLAASVPSALIEALAEQPAQKKALYDAGDQLKVIDGPFIGFEAELLRLYEAPDGEARVMVLMDILTRPQKICLPASAVRKAA